MNLSQSAYSRIESGQTAVSLNQVRAAAHALNMLPAALLQKVDKLEDALRRQKVSVIAEKLNNVAEGLLALGLLAAVVAALAD